MSNNENADPNRNIEDPSEVIEILDSDTEAEGMAPVQNNEVINLFDSESEVEEMVTVQNNGPTGWRPLKRSARRGRS